MELRRRKREGETTNTSKASDTDGDSDVHSSSSSSEAAADAVVGAAVRGGSLLMLLALIQRASTFVLNVLLQRAMLSEHSTSSSDPNAPSHTTNNNNDSVDEPVSSALEAYGAAAITLELISSTALFLAREPFRVALARSRVPADAAAAAAAAAAGGRAEGGGRDGVPGRCRREAYRQRFVNTAWMSAPVGLAFAVFVRLAYRWVIRNDAFDGVEENRQAVTLVCLAAAVELLCEPLALIFQFRLLIDVRVRTEAAAVLVLGVSRYLLVARAGMGVLSFGYAQLLHSATLAAGYIVFAVKDVATKAAAEAPPPPPLLNSNPHGSAREPPPAGPSATSHPGALEGKSDNDRGFASMRGWLPRRPQSARESNGAAGSGAEDGSWVDRGKLRLAGALAGQSLLKHVLTEGDKIVLARATSLGQSCGSGSGGGESGSVGAGCGQSGSLYEQGVYAIASGYGSLAARLLFQPLEEAARLMFSKLGAEEGEGRSANQWDERPSPAAATLGGPGASNIRTEGTQPPMGSRGWRGRQDGDGEGFGGGGGGGEAVGDSSRRLRERMAALLATLLKLVLTAGLVFVCFGFHYTETLLRLLLSGKGSGGGGGGRSSAVPEVAQVLSWYCVYVLFLAANGMCEAFACAVARGGHLAGMGAGLVASFAAFWALVGPLTARFGTRGLVMANAAGMACRVTCSGVFIRRFFLQGTTSTATPLRSSSSSSSSSPDTSSSSLPPPTPGNNTGRRKKTNRESRNLWRQVVARALPHPGVAAAMALSSAAAFAASPSSSSAGGGDVPWDAAGAARHVGVGVACFVATAVVFARCEAVFVREVAALWAARRRSSSRGDGDGGGVVEVREKTA